MAQDVTVRVLDQHGNAVQDIGVHLYDDFNLYRVDNGFTDSAGEVLFAAVDEGTKYLRFYGKARHATIETPQQITVQDPPNIFEVGAILPQAPAARTPVTCRMYGYFNNPSLFGRRVAIHITSLEDPILVSPGGESGNTLIPSDEEGYVEFDLVRNGLYSAVIPGYENEPIIFRVPDLETADITKVLFPAADTLVFDPAGPLALLVDECTELTGTTLTLNSGLVLSGDTYEDVPITRFIEYVSSDDEVASVSTGDDGTPVVCGVGAGTAQISAELKDPTDSCSAIAYPVTSLTVTPVDVTVT